MTSDTKTGKEACMNPVTLKDLERLYVPPHSSHKGQNGRLLIIGGSSLFHAASLWALEVASRIVDLVHYSSTPENNELVMDIKKEFRDGIVIPRSDLDAYIEEDDVILIGLGMTRDDETESLTNTVLRKYPQKQWVIDAGALQMMDNTLIPKNAILTPHQGEFESLIKRDAEVAGINFDSSSEATRKVDLSPNDSRVEDEQSFSGSPHRLTDKVKLFSEKYHCIVLLKGQQDIACDGEGHCRGIAGGNAGMTKGGTGDVLAGLIAALACKNEPFLATIAGSYINKKAGDELSRTVGPYFNASDLAAEIPRVMHSLLP
ncbi:NAD(P)H-hydrate dehydratase [Patescibacteria group bacterium]|nr:NAD(P)H-hydrate dehydratase [Patescibacteria group bacterium]